MQLQRLREEVCAANLRLAAEGLVTLTWGNVSGIDADRAVMAIKPSGVPYDQLTPQRVVLVGIADGEVVAGDLRPSSDTPTHLALYRAFPACGGVTHTHSPKATAFAQARRPIPCLGTTHADHFAREVPVTRPLTEQEVEEAYEAHTGDSIVELFEGAGLDPVSLPAVLLAGHAPFAWGPTAAASVDNAIALEAVAGMALDTAALSGGSPPPLEAHVLRKHHLRKHGPDATYGQK